MTADHPFPLSEPEVSVAQAARLLNVSEAFVRDLLAAGEIASRETPGGGTRVLTASLIAYQQRDNAHRHAAVDELTRLSQALDLEGSLRVPRRGPDPGVEASPARPRAC